MALHLKLKPQCHPSPLSSLRLLSSSPLPPPPPPPPPSDESPPESQSQSNVSSYFRDIKQRLGSPPSPPHRIPTDPPPPPSFFPPQSQKPSASLEEIRKSLANFRLSSPPSSSSSTPQFSPPKFQDIFKNNIQNNPSRSASPVSFDSIRQNLRQSRSNDTFFNLKNLQENIRSKGPQPGAPRAPSLIGSDSKLPEAIFGREARERDGGEGEKESNELKTEFTKQYTHQELGEKLVRLRPEGGEKKKEGFSLNELNQRLVKLRKLEMEEAKLNESPFSIIRETLHNIQNSEDAKKRQRSMPILTSLGGLVTPSFMLKQPQEQLLEKYFHPDHMSSAEKMKLELKKVRDEFKMSESDCGSARVQVAQLTTKIKHLSTVLNKKDKHSKKGLKEMVQRRKKLLKYLRRTDWDSYCLVLSKLGLRDVPEYKAPDYKTFTQAKTKSKSKSKSKSRGRGRAKIKA